MLALLQEHPTNALYLARIRSCRDTLELVLSKPGQKSLCDIKNSILRVLSPPQTLKAWSTASTKNISSGNRYWLCQNDRWRNLNLNSHRQIWRPVQQWISWATVEFVKTRSIQFQIFNILAPGRVHCIQFQTINILPPGRVCCIQFQIINILAPGRTRGIQFQIISILPPGGVCRHSQPEFDNQPRGQPKKYPAGNTEWAIDGPSRWTGVHGTEEFPVMYSLTAACFASFYMSFGLDCAERSSSYKGTDWAKSHEYKSRGAWEGVSAHNHPVHQRLYRLGGPSGRIQTSSGNSFSWSPWRCRRSGTYSDQSSCVIQKCYYELPIHVNITVGFSWPLGSVLNRGGGPSIYRTLFISQKLRNWVRLIFNMSRISSSDSLVRIIGETMFSVQLGYLHECVIF